MSILHLPESPFRWRDTRPPTRLELSPLPIDPRHLARMTAARVLADEVRAQYDPALDAADRAAYEANIAAGAALNAALAELASLSTDDAADDLSDDAVSAQAVRRLALGRQIPQLQRRLAKAQQDADARLLRRRAALLQALNVVEARERERLRGLMEQRDQLDQQIADGELTLIQARSLVGADLPRGEA